MNVFRLTFILSFAAKIECYQERNHRQKKTPFWRKSEWNRKNEIGSILDSTFTGKNNAIRSLRSSPLTLYCTVFFSIFKKKNSIWTICVLLTSTHRRVRLAWCEDHRHWNRDQWEQAFHWWVSAHPKYKFTTYFYPEKTGEPLPTFQLLRKRPL